MTCVPKVGDRVKFRKEYIEFVRKDLADCQGLVDYQGTVDKNATLLVVHIHYRPAVGQYLTTLVDEKIFTGITDPWDTTVKTDANGRYITPAGQVQINTSPTGEKRFIGKIDYPGYRLPAPPPMTPFKFAENNTTANDPAFCRCNGPTKKVAAGIGPQAVFYDYCTSCRKERL